MALFFTGDEKYRDLIHDDDYRSYLITRRYEPGGYRFGRTQGKRIRVHARIALRHVNGYFRTMIEAVANAKLRRMTRELELRGIRYDQPTMMGWRANPSRQSVPDAEGGPTGLPDSNSPFHA